MGTQLIAVSKLTSIRPIAQAMGTNVIATIAAEVAQRMSKSVATGYNERYIDEGPAWQEHINYSDGGQHGQTHRNGS